MNDVPKSLKVALALITVAIPVFTTVINYGIYGYRIEQLEIEVRAIQDDRARRIEDYQRFQQQISTDVATTRTNVDWLVRQAQQKKLP